MFNGSGASVQLLDAWANSRHTASVGINPPAWECGAQRSDMYLSTDNWEEDNTNVKVPYKVYEVQGTFAMIARKAAFARLPSEEDTAGLPFWLQNRLGAALIALGGKPEMSGVGVGIVDVFTDGWSRKFRPDALVVHNAEHHANLTRASLHPGRYCHALAFDRRPWSDLYVSR